MTQNRPPHLSDASVLPASGGSIRRTLVLGGGGTGRALAGSAAQRGDPVVLASRTDPRRPGVTHLRFDPADDSGPAPAQVVDLALERLDGLDLLVTCVGTRLVRGRLAHHTDRDWYEAYDANVLTPLRAYRQALPALRASRGTIINVVALHDLRPNPAVAPYSAAEAALDALTRALAADLAHDGVRVFGVAPAGPDSRPPATRERRGSLSGRLAVVGAHQHRTGPAEPPPRIPLVGFTDPDRAARQILELADDPASSGATYLVPA